jgi:flagellar hook-associated protein 2
VGTKQVTISSSNNTLQGIRDAINAANIGVKASIINDGGASPYRLVLQSANTGANRSLRISASGDASISSLLSHDPTATQNLTQTAAALDAAIKINGVDISSHSNTVSGALEGVSLTLAKTGSTSLNIARDTASVQSGIEALVKSYNEFEATLGDLSKFDPATKKGGPLIGDSTLRSVENQLRQALTGNISGVSGNSYSVLSQIGLSFQRDGTLSLDSSKLSDALNTDVDAVAALFASVGLSSDSLVEVSKFTSNTAPGIYAVSVSQLATQGTLVGAAAAGLAISASSNDQLTVDVDGTSANITLTAGTYTATDLAAELESKINGASAISGAGLSVKVTESAGVLTVTSGSYGSSSAVSVTGTAASNLFGGSPVAAAGLDVAGTIGGISATGKGQTLVANSTSAADGLELTIAGGNTGDRGVINFSRGYAHRLGLLLDNQIAGDGLIAGRTDGINRSIKDLDSQREALQRRLDLVEQRYRAQFTALDGLISSMNSTSTFLAQQLASLPGTR